MEEANGLVRWPEETPALGQREEDLQGFPLEELPRKNSGARAEAEPEAEASQDVLDVVALAREVGDQPAILPHYKE